MVKSPNVLSIHGKMRNKRFKIFDKFRKMESGMYSTRLFFIINLHFQAVIDACCSFDGTFVAILFIMCIFRVWYHQSMNHGKVVVLYHVL